MLLVQYHAFRSPMRIDRVRNPTCGLDNNVTLQRGIIKGYELYRSSPTRKPCYACKELWLNQLRRITRPIFINRSISRF